MFSNGTEYMLWQGRNCDNCAKYENESTEVGNAGCRIAFYIDLCSVTGELPPDVDKITEQLDCPAFETF